jgi:RNA polymerase sigma-70 factor (ECF subfamily)
MGPQPETVRELFDREYAPLVRLATIITGDGAAAEDAVQEAFARAIARWARLQTYDRPGAWLRRVTIRLAVRSRAARAELRPVPEGAAPAVDPPDAELLDALRALPPHQRAALALFYLEGLTTAEVAGALSVRASTARSHLHRGRAALAQRLALPEVVTDGN